MSAPDRFTWSPDDLDWDDDEPEERLTGNQPHSEQHSLRSEPSPTVNVHSHSEVHRYSKRYSEDQPRDEHGRFAGGGTGDTFSPLTPGPAHTDEGSVATTGVLMGSGMSASGLKAQVAQRIADRLTATHGTKFDDQLVASLVQTQAYDSNWTPKSVMSNVDNVVVRSTENGSAAIMPIYSLEENQKKSLAEADHNPTRFPGGMVSSFAAHGGWEIARVTKPDAIQMIREAGVARLIHQWAQTSNDDDPVSLAIQESARQEFGLKDTAGWLADTSSSGAINPTSIQVQKELDTNGDMYRAFLRAQYNETQETLKDLGITSLSLHRGAAVSSDAQLGFKASAKPQDTITDVLRPLSSWSLDRDEADKFARSRGADSASGIILDAQVPADRILSSPVTGLGCLKEQEVVILGGTDTVSISRPWSTKSPEHQALADAAYKALSKVETKSAAPVGRSRHGTDVGISAHPDESAQSADIRTWVRHPENRKRKKKAKKAKSFDPSPVTKVQDGTAGPSTGVSDPIISGGVTGYGVTGYRNTSHARERRVAPNYLEPSPKITNISRHTPEELDYRLTDNPNVSCHQCVNRIDNGDKPSACLLMVGTVDPEHVCDEVELPDPADWEEQPGGPTNVTAMRPTTQVTLNVSGIRERILRYSEDQPRDPDGKFSSGGSEPTQPSFTDPVHAIADGKQGYLDSNKDLGAPGNLSIDYMKIQADPVVGKAIADIYNAAPLDDPAAHAAYEQLGKETAAQYEYLTKTLGVTVEVTQSDPYKTVKDMADDLRNNNHLSVLSTAATGGHPFFTNEQNDQFRAVHDAFGHAASGRGFDRNGEAAAWVAHMQMYSPLAGKALTTETRAQNSAMIYGHESQPLIPSVNPKDTGGFPPQKIMILPDEYTTAEVRAKVTTETQAQADADNLYSIGHCHHTSQGRHFPVVETRYSEDQPRDEHGRFASGGGSEFVSAADIPSATHRYSKRYSEDQPRDDHGRFASGDSESSTGSALSPPTPSELANGHGQEELADAQFAAFQNHYGDVGIDDQPRGLPPDMAYKAMVATNIANGMVAKDGTKWDDHFISSSWVSPSRDMYTFPSGTRLAEPLSKEQLLNADTVVSRGSTGQAYIGSLTGEHLSMSDQATVVKMLNESPSHTVTNRDLAAVRGWFASPLEDPDSIQFARGDTPEALQMVREAAVAGLIHTWASTSNDTSPMSLAIQESAVKEFGLKDTAEWKMSPGAPLSFEANVRDELEKNGEFFQAFLRAQYNETQRQFKDLAGKTPNGGPLAGVTLYRGQVAASPQEDAFAAAHPPIAVSPGEGEVHVPSHGGDDTVLTSRPLSSWTTSAAQGRAFGIGFSGTAKQGLAEGHAGLMYSATVPADRILSTPSSGFGCWTEDEVVILGGTDTVHCQTVRSADTPEGVSWGPADMKGPFTGPTPYAGAPTGHVLAEG